MAEFSNYLSDQHSDIDRDAEMRTNTKLYELMKLPSARYILFKKLQPLVNRAITPSWTVQNEEISQKNEQKLAEFSIFNYSAVQPIVDEIFQVNNSEKFWPRGVLYIGKNGIGKHNLPVSQKEWSGEGNINHLYTMDISYAKKSTSDEFEAGNDFVGEFIPSRSALVTLTNKHLSLFAHAHSMLCWHERYKFCSTCGNRMRLEESGYKGTCLSEECSSNKGVHNTCYPRTDPVVIMCVQSTDKRRCLLGRKKGWNMFSCLAGFVEPGEAAEDAVRRETVEESGVKVHQVIYHSSQPWPFPSSLMLGFQATALNEDVKVNKEELEEAKWFDREEVALAVQGNSSLLQIPPKQTIAHQLIKAWATQ